MTICDIDWCVSSLGFCLTNFFKAHGNKSWYLRDETCIWEMGAEDIETFQQVSLSTCAWYDYIVTICHLHQWQLITSFHVRRVPSTFRPSRDKRFKMPWSFLVLPSTKVLESLTSGRHRAHRHGSMAAKQRSHGKLRLQGRRLKKNLKLEMLSTSLYMYYYVLFICFDTRSMSEAALDIFAEVSQKKLFQQVEVNEPAKHRHDEIHWNTEKQVKRKIPSRRKKSVKDEHSHWTFKIKSLNTYR